jgi:hypothetical protein
VYVYAYVYVHISRYHLTTKRNTHYGSAYYMALLIMAARYHLIKITKRNIADFDFRLKACTCMCMCMSMGMHVCARARARACAYA